MLAVNDLAVSYDAVTALRGVSFEVPDRAIVALLGANGAGKSTVLRALSGLLALHRGRVRSGEVLLDGEPIHAVPAAALARRGIKHVLEGRRVFKELTVEENLRVGAYPARRFYRSNLDRVYTLFPRLHDRRNGNAGYLSGGEQQMLAMGRALMSGPRFLLLDEPSLGLAPRVVGQIRDTVVDINAQGTGVLLVEQNATMALDIAHHGVVLETGSIAVSQPAKELRKNRDIREFYLGISGEGAERSYRNIKQYRRGKEWTT